MRAHLGRLALSLLAVTAAGACGYALAGRGNALPASIQTIGVPQFVNHSTMSDIDRVLTDIVRAEFQSRGKYRVEPDVTGADALLTVSVANVTLHPSAFTADRQVSSYSIVVTANVEFKDVKANNVLWSNPSFRVTDEYPVAPSATVVDAATFFSRESNSKERLARKFAREIVTSIFEAF